MKQLKIKVGPVNCLEGENLPQYKIKTINDLYQVVTKENLEMIMTDMKAFLSLLLELEEKSESKLKITHFNWVDDWSEQDKEDHFNFINR